MLRGELVLAACFAVGIAHAQEGSPSQTETPTQAPAPPASPASTPETAAPPGPSSLRVGVSAAGAAEVVRVPDATVVLVAADGSAAAMKTKEDGCAEARVPPGTYRATIVAPGATPKDMSVTVTAEGTSLDVR